MKDDFYEVDQPLHFGLVQCKLSLNGDDLWGKTACFRLNEVSMDITIKHLASSNNNMLKMDHH